MKYFTYMLFACVLSTGCGSAQLAQSPNTLHTVNEGETIYSISKKYGVSREAIYKQNPAAKSGIQVNSVLVIPTGGKETVTKDNPPFILHKVKRRQTLFSISKKYGISQDEIKKYNKALYARQVKKDETLRIPRIEKIAVAPPEDKTETTGENPTGKATHTVKPKETLFGIAHNYGITIAELQALNPGLDPSLPIGSKLNVPAPSTEVEVIDPDRFSFYVVRPKEGFFRLKVKLGLSEEAIVSLNPFAKEGLKEGMVLKIPKAAAGGAIGEIRSVSLENRIRNRDNKNLAVLLPFRLNKTTGDSVSNNQNIIKNDALMRIALDFYSGVLLAATFAKDQGIPVTLNVYDTQGSAGKTRAITAGQNFKNIDAVIGPLRQENVEEAASELRNSDTPVFSPLSNKEIRIYKNLFQTLPSETMLQEGMLDYIATNGTEKNILLISDGKNMGQRDKITARIPWAKPVRVRKGNFMYPQDIAQNLDRQTDNWVIMASQDPGLVSTVVGLLNGLAGRNKLRLFTLDKNSAYDYHDVSNMSLAKLGFTFPSVNKSYDFKTPVPFTAQYKKRYGVLPNKYAVRGFDITYDVLLRLAAKGDVFKGINGEEETEYIENKFRYTKKLMAGYQNQSFYIIKYTKDLQFEVVK